MANDKQIEEENLEVLADYYEFHSKIAKLTSITESLEDGMSKAQIHTELSSMQEVANRFRNFLSSRIPAKHFNQCKAPESTIPSRVLAILELLEHILYQCSSLQEVLNMSQVSKEIHAIVKASPKLQIKLHYKAADSSKFREHQYTTPFKPSLSMNSTYPGFCVTPNTMMIVKNQLKRVDIKATFTCLRAAKNLPKIGLSWQRMSVCQPPIYEMTAQATCSAHGPIYCSGTVSSRVGISIGDLLAKATELLARDDRISSCWRCVMDVRSTSKSPSHLQRIETDNVRLQVTFWAGEHEYTAGSS